MNKHDDPNADPMRDLMNDLNNLQPQVDPVFQQQLENRLVARLEQQQQERMQHNMQSNGHLKTLPLPNRVIDFSGAQARRLPITMIATIAILIGLVSLFGWIINQDDSGQSSGAVQVENMTPTPVSSAAPLNISPTVVPLDHQFDGEPVQQGEIRGEAVISVRADTSPDSDALYTVEPGEVVSVVGMDQSGGWYFILKSNHIELVGGWIEADHLHLLPAPVAITATPIPVQPTALPPTVPPTALPPTVPPPAPADGTICAGNTIPVLVAGQDIPRATRLTPEQLMTVCWSGSAEGIISNLNPGSTFYLTTDLRRGQPLHSAYVVSEDVLSPAPDFGTAGVDPDPASNTIAYLPLDPAQSYFLQIGDSVTLTFTSMTLPASDDTFVIRDPNNLFINPGEDAQVVIEAMDATLQGQTPLIQVHIMFATVAEMRLATTADDQLLSYIGLTMQNQDDRMMIPWVLESQLPYILTITNPAAPLVAATPAPVVAEPLPDWLDTSRIRQEYQTWNNQGPATLAMALSYYGVEDTQAEIAAVLKPNPDDKSVSPHELVDYVNQQTDLRALYRVGGTLDLLKNLIAADFPVVVQTGFFNENAEWYGHYRLPIGADNAANVYIFDSMQGNSNGAGLQMKESEFMEDWRAGNHTFIVVYEAEREAELMDVLGEPYATLEASAEGQLFYGDEMLESGTASGFDWQNYGINFALVGEYDKAAIAFSKAFDTTALMVRVMWYQHLPYLAYFGSGRYGEVITLADIALDSSDELAEAYLYQGAALAAQGDFEAARSALQLALDSHPDFAPAHTVMMWLEDETFSPERFVQLMEDLYFNRISD